MVIKRMWACPRLVTPLKMKSRLVEITRDWSSCMGVKNKVPITADRCRSLNHGWTRINTDFLTEANEGNKGDTGFTNWRFQNGESRWFMGLKKLKRDNPGRSGTIRD